MPRPSRWNDLVAAAAEEFAEHGFERATIEGIAQRLGILKGSVYHYVESKEELLYAVVEAPATRILQEMELLAQDGRSAVERLRAVFHLQIRIFSDYYPAAFVYLRQVGQETQPPEFRKRDARYMHLLERIIADGVRLGEFSLSTSPRLAALAVVGILNWMSQWYSPTGQASPDQLADALFAIAVGGLGRASEVVGDLQPFGSLQTEELSPN